MVRIFLAGNWRHRNGYIGEPQRTLQQIIAVVNSQSGRVKVLKKDGLQKEEKTSVETLDKYLVFGNFTPVMVRFLSFLLQGAKDKDIFFYFYKNKYSFKDILYFFKIVPVGKAKFLIRPSIFEVFLPDFLYKGILKLFSKKIIFTSALDVFIGKERGEGRFLLCSNMEERRLARIKRMASFEKRVGKREAKIVYFGGDAYLRGVDVLADMKPRVNGMTVQKFLYLPYKDYLWERRRDLFQRKSPYLKIIYKADDRVLEKIKDAAFSVFAFRTRAGPDIPAALVEAFILGVPPVISEILYFGPLKRFDYPLVLAAVNPQELEKVIACSIRDKASYDLVLRKCQEIAEFFVVNHGFKIESVAREMLNKMGLERIA